MNHDEFSGAPPCRTPARGEGFIARFIIHGPPSYALQLHIEDESRATSS